MAAFFLVRRANQAEPEPRYQDLKANFESQEWAAPVELSAGGCDICLYPKRSGAPVSIHKVDGANFCASTGTLIYKKCVGAGAVDQ